MKSPATQPTPRPRWMLPVAIAAGAAVVLAGSAVAFSVANSAAPVPAGPTRSAASGSLYAPATFTGWASTNDTDTGTEFSVDADTAKDGPVSLRVDSTTGASKTRRGLSQVIAVTPKTTYTFSAWIKSPEAGATTKPVAFVMGAEKAKRFMFPAGAARWSEASWSYKTGAGQTNLPVAIVPSGPTQAFLVDGLQVTPTDGSPDGQIVNASFEEYASPNGILNKALVLETGAKGLDLAWFTKSVDWAVSDETNGAVASGTLPIVGGKGVIPVTDLKQGYYKIAVSATGDPASAITTAFMLLDPLAEGTSASDERFGVGAHIGEPYYVGSEGSAAALGLRSMRTDAYWPSAEQAKGQFSFPDSYESSFPAFEKAGLSVLPISNGANGLYDGGKIPTSAEGIQAYANYTAALVSRYSSPAVEIFNELNSHRFNDSECGLGADCYLPLLRASAEAVKAKNPATLIVGPANANQDDPYLTELYKIGGLKYLDVVSYHPYVEQPELLTADIQKAQARIKEYNNGQDKPIWLTEFGTPSKFGEPSERSQADFLVRAETIALSNGVKKVFWYDLVNDSTDSADHEGNFGLLRRPTATVHAFEPKPSAMAQAMLIRKLSAKEPAGSDALGKTAFSYVYGVGSATTRVAWATVPTTVTFASTTPLAVTTASGQVTSVAPVAGQVSVTLGAQPVYVDGALAAPALVG
ncbi:hypothetical protein RCH16_000195 [Cryobacterium sp. MP_M5]|uniref:glycosyl hydrolase n=1 Tax=unclassified Cryobacterium TaxID=2649013 RepID=UPI0018CA7585|nr:MULTISPECIES: glycosyl hydrolase [unclassified Cryobacterium]MBG6057009.1 hypothetical protein [Cryobacterium sp. MP_M3]MEC5175208.1 hypothetical protein [Cryobacterium sp. MP_M5]